MAKKNHLNDLGAPFEGSEFDNIGGNEMDEEKKEKEPTFNDFVKQYGVDKAVARGLQTKMKVPEDGAVKEADFVKALKEFTTQTPR